MTSSKVQKPHINNLRHMRIPLEVMEKMKTDRLQEVIISFNFWLQTLKVAHWVIGARLVFYSWRWSELWWSMISYYCYLQWEHIHIYWTRGYDNVYFIHVSQILLRWRSPFLFIGRFLTSHLLDLDGWWIFVKKNQQVVWQRWRIRL